MELQFYGANCIKVVVRKTTIIIDDNLKFLGGDSVAKAGDVRVFTSQSTDAKLEDSFVIAQPGEYEIGDVSITGVAAQAHVDEPGTTKATIYKIVGEDVRLAVVGHINPDLSEGQLENIGNIDVLVVPVGGHGFTLDAIGAQKVIKELEPKLVIPTYYDDNKLKFEVPAAKLDDVLKELAIEPKETTSKLKIKAADLLNDQPQLVVLQKQ